MVQSLVITLREGIEAALVVGIILVYLRKTDRLALQRSVYVGLGLAVAASLIVAFLFQLLNIDPDNEYFEGTVFGVAGVLVVTMVVWMWRTAGNTRMQIEGRLSNLVSAGSDPGRQSLGLLVFTFVMVFREGVETVLFVSAATLGEFDLLTLTGAVLGLCLAVLFAVLLVKGSVRVNLSRFFVVTSFILFLLAVRLLAGSVHEFAERGVLPMSKEIMAVLGYLVRDNASTMILMALLAAPVFMILWDTAGSHRSAPAVSDLPSAERRKRIATARRERLWRASLAGAGLLIVLTMASTVFAGSKFNDPAPEPVGISGDRVTIPLEKLQEGRLHKFMYDADGVPIRFLAMKHTDGTVHVGFDACSICGSVGYMQEGADGNAICKNCNAAIPASTIGEGGGCNPLPLEAQAARDQLTIPVAALLEGREKFAR